MVNLNTKVAYLHLYVENKTMMMMYCHIVMNGLKMDRKNLKVTLRDPNFTVLTNYGIKMAS